LECVEKGLEVSKVIRKMPLDISVLKQAP